ncbi:MAG: hypothetical protein WCG25_01140 [bacterium]
MIYPSYSCQILISLIVKVSQLVCTAGLGLDVVGVDGLDVQVVHVFVGLLGSVDVCLVSSFGIEASNLFTFGQNFRKSFFAGSSPAFLMISSNCFEQSNLFPTRITSGQLFSILIV